MIPRIIKNIEVIHGCEINVLNNGTLSLEEKYIDYLDYVRLVQAAKQYHVALEVSNSSLVKKDKRLNCYENYEKMLTLCQQYKVPIIVSSDAHDPSWVGYFDLALDLLEKFHFDESLILNNDIDKLKQFIKKLAL
ncbi:hypothetical protein [Floccifex sp.]|uniref:hypothetical protein n=1 Tax=Floccifex sp. TaxID=2815810 RepID=UPI002A75A1E9|nr:hypothetical protein [Floccifex sp.]MDD7281966.1 hypothetical protein [Erysipelotrichaceae bacterium]MDY2957875.1 hypothetical protein [Floccifex sp.]